MPVVLQAVALFLVVREAAEMVDLLHKLREQPILAEAVEATAKAPQAKREVQTLSSFAL